MTTYHYRLFRTLTLGCVLLTLSPCLSALAEDAKGRGPAAPTGAAKGDQPDTSKKGGKDDNSGQGNGQQNGASVAADNDPTTGLTALFALLTALSAATQRLVDIFKPWAKWFGEKPLPVDSSLTGADKAKDELRFAKATDSYERGVHVVAICCGIITACVSKGAIEATPALKGCFTYVGSWPATVVIGVLASSTSGPWNSITDWLKGLKKPGTP